MSETINIGRMVKITGTTSATPGTQTTHPYSMGGRPIAVLILFKGNGVVYQSAAPDKRNIYVKGSAASLAFEAVLLS